MATGDDQTHAIKPLGANPPCIFPPNPDPQTSINFIFSVIYFFIIYRDVQNTLKKRIFHFFAIKCHRTFRAVSFLLHSSQEPFEKIKGEKYCDPKTQMAKNMVLKKGVLCPVCASVQDSTEAA